MTDARSHAVQGAAGLELARLRQFTPARIGLGRAGTGVPTAASLQFMLDHAKARDAVHRALDFAQLGEAVAARGWRVAHVRSAARNRAEYLRRPDLGRRLASEARLTLEALADDPDVAIVAADGLSATAIMVNLQPLLDHLMPGLVATKPAVSPIILVEQGRVAIGDEIGEILGARLVLLLVGERPGLSAADSLSCYITWNPRVGTMDSSRHCVSNIRSAGLPVATAAELILRLVGSAFFYRATGIRLNKLHAAGMPVGTSAPRPIERTGRGQGARPFE